MIKVLFSITDAKQVLIGYADSGYLSDAATFKSQTGYCFLLNGSVVSWKSQKQSTVATSSNHAELIALHEATKEAVWLRQVLKFLSSTFQLDLSPTVIYEDNAAALKQVESGYIKTDRTKHMNPKLWYTREVNGSEVKIMKISSEDNTADIFTKALPKALHWKHMAALGMTTLPTTTTST